MIRRSRPSNIRHLVGVRHHLAATLAAFFSLGLLAAGCGGNETTGSAGDYDGAPVELTEAAADPSKDAFPVPDGRSLEDLAALAQTGLEIAPATQLFTPGINRMAFGLIDSQGGAAYAPTAVYVGRKPDSVAKGPYLAPTDSLVTEPSFQSRNAATEDDPFASVYEAEVDLPGEGNWAVLVLSDHGGDKLLGATTQLKVEANDRVPSVGDSAPPSETDTVAKAGDITDIDTRVPPDSMHETALTDVLGKRPVALLFATPALCQSRVCGPVTDIAEQLKSEYGDEIEFIHQEVYVDNDPAKGIRQPLVDYGLRSEPWLFTIGADGVIAARLEGSFGQGAFEDAVQKAIDQ